MSEEDTLRAGISVLKSGERAQAAALFAQVVKSNPSSEQGWYYLGISCVASDQREYCFKRVLALNPKNLDAQKQLAILSKPESDSPPSWASQPPPVYQPINTLQPVSSAKEEKSSSFVYENDEASLAFESKASAPPVEQSLRESAKPENPPRKRQNKKKNSNMALALTLLGVPLLIACGVGIAYLFLSGRMAQWTSPVGPVSIPIADQTPTPLAVASPTFTLAPPTLIPSPAPTVAYTPVFENSPCTFEIPYDADVSCGFLTVPEDRTGDPSHTIKLAVAVFHSSNKNSNAVPVMFLQGGPGAEAVQLSADAYEYLVAPFLPERDFIVFDQRGTGLSEPALKCDELSKVYAQDIHGMIPASTREIVYSNAFLSCNGLMFAQGIQLNAYTTVESAADLKDVLHALGYQKVNLYGASYGTRLALVVMREYPEIVQTAILDSVVPVDTNLFLRYPDAVNSALRALFDTCSADPECNTAYPNLETVFWELVSELDANPVTVTTSTYPIGTITETVNGSTLISVVLGSVKSSSLIYTAPQTIYRIRGGDYSTLIAAQYSMPFAFEDINPGLYISMMCHEHIMSTTLDELQSISMGQSMKDYAWLPFYGDANDLFKTCKSWGSLGPAYGENDAVSSDIPALVIAGKYDPATPPIYAQQVASQLSNSYYFEFPNQGHVPTGADISGCAMDTVLAFLDTPLVEPSRDCLNRLDQVDFLLPYTGIPALSLSRQRSLGVTVDAPDDWYSYGDGFFIRGNSPMDITQIGALRTDISVEELKDWFSLSAYGYRGLDAAPVSVGKRDANGLSWTLYLGTSNGRPVDIAMANSGGGNSLVVMMFSHLDEHDALYRTVFLPMVDSAR